MRGAEGLVDVLVVAGSNINKERCLPAAISRMRHNPELIVVTVSEPYESASVGGPPDAPDYHNVAILLRTILSPKRLRRGLRGIEHSLGRKRGGEPNAPRTIDLDIIYYSDLVQDFGNWSIPDSDALKHRYAAVPIAQIAPEWVHPVTGQSALSIANELDAAGNDQAV